MTRTETLQAAEKAVNGDRQGEYGTPENNFKNIAGFWSLYLSSRLNKEIELQPVDVAVMLDLMKTARLIQSPRKLDTWIDKAGYAACGAEIVSHTISTYKKGGYETMNHKELANLIAESNCVNGDSSEPKTTKKL